MGLALPASASQDDLEDYRNLRAVHEIYRTECTRYWNDIVEATKNASARTYMPETN